MAVLRIKSISEMHRLLRLEPPKHPLITIFNWEDIRPEVKSPGMPVSFDFYLVSQKELPCGELKYGRNTYDFGEGTMMFIGPGQVMSSTIDSEPSGWALFFHPDLIRKTALGQKMNEFSFFKYDVNEALHLSEKEKGIVKGIVDQIREEYSGNIDTFTQDLIVSQLELLFNYAQRFYSRQFITRTAHNSDLVSRFESELKEWFDSEKPKEIGLPSVKICAEALGMSPDYLSDMLRQETGKNAQEHIHYVVIDRAKNELLSSSHTVSEIAYALGFEYPQYFSKLFKKKVGMTPAQFRKN